VVLSDVVNPLTGPDGAAAVFGPQKGLVGPDVERVDRGLARLARLLGVDPATPGAGAAGGTGAALLAWGARLVPGAPEIARLVGLPEAVARADLVVTGEGAYDAQSAAGKAPGYVADLARGHGVAVALVAGRVAPGSAQGFAAEAALADPARWLRVAGAQLAATLGSGAESDGAGEPGSGRGGAGPVGAGAEGSTPPDG
jgi:glycerate kinase